MALQRQEGSARISAASTSPAPRRFRSPSTAFGILGGVDEATLKAEEDFASIVVDPKINAEFASLKGSTPVRADVPTDKLDACNKLVLDSLKKERFWVLNPFYIGDPDWNNSVWNTMFTFQGDPSMTTDDAIAMLGTNTTRSSTSAALRWCGFAASLELPCNGPAPPRKRRRRHSAQPLPSAHASTEIVRALSLTWRSSVGSRISSVMQARAGN